ncbi:MAG TPA: CDP-alcohol phosphatidyltransferase family protein [Polyangiaceae bacterium]
MIDLALSLTFLAATGVAGAAYGVRVLVRGRARHARIEKEGESAFLSKGPMEMMYWFMQPAGHLALKLGMTANMATMMSLTLGLAAGVALGLGHFGVAALIATVSAAGDALDGWIARETGTSSNAGEVFDAAVDRYVELAFLAGLAFYFRNHALVLCLALLALGGSFMVSYATAKAEAMQVTAPRGAMRRTERAVYLTAAIAITPIFQALSHDPTWSVAPIAFALALVGVVGNASAVRRLMIVAQTLRERENPSKADVVAPAPEHHSNAELHRLAR